MKAIFNLFLATLLTSFGSPAVLHAADGTALWTNVFNGPGNGADEAIALALDGSGNVYVTGYSQGSGSGLDYATLKYSSSGVPLWTNRFNGTGNSSDYPAALAVDAGSNVYVTGRSMGSGSGYDYATIKYSGAGVALWTNRFNGAGNWDDFARSVAVDGGGNVYVTGHSQGSASAFDYATIKYSSAGAPVWTNLFNGAANLADQAFALALDGSGNVYVTGLSGSGSGYDYATIKYSSAGAPQWTNRFNGTGNGADEPTALAVDGSGNVYVTGYSHRGGSAYEYATIKYSGAGVALWTNRFNGAGNDLNYPDSLAADGNGNVYVTGYAYGSGSEYDYATIKYSSAGAPIWTNVFNGAGNDTDAAYALALDGGGNVYVTGVSVASEGLGDYATIKYSTAGAPLWTNRFNGAGNGYEEAFALAVDSNGSVYVTGYTTGSGGGHDYATIKYAGPPLSFITTGDNLGFTNRQFRLTVTGPGGANAVISASTNLLSWTPLATNSLGSGTLTYTDALASNFIHRFYRAHSR